MLTRLIVSFYSGLIEIALWLLIAVGGIAGYKFTSTVGGGDSAFIGGVVGAAVVFVIAAVLFGGFLVLDDIRRSVRRIEVLAEEDRGSRDFTPSQVAPSANSRTDKISINAAVAPEPAQAPVPSNLMSPTEYKEMWASLRRYFTRR